MIKMRISWGSILMVHSLEIEHSPGHLEDSFWRILENNIGNRLLKSENLWWHDIIKIEFLLEGRCLKIKIFVYITNMIKM